MLAPNNDRLFVITGGPGSGKTTLINALAACGYTVMPEGARAIIQRQVATGGNALPWSDRLAFAELMLQWDLRSYQAALEVDGPVIFDRGIPDSSATCNFADCPCLVISKKPRARTATIAEYSSLHTGKQSSPRTASASKQWKKPA